MKLKQAAPRRSRIDDWRAWARSWPRLSRSLIRLALLLLAFGAGMLAYRQQLHRLVRSVASANALLLPHTARGWLARPPRMQLDIELEDYLELQRQRREALAQGFLFVDDGDYVPAELRLDGETIPLRLRLKGDHVDHLEGDTWSFRLQTKGDATVLGMKQLSLHHPRTRSYAYEWLYQRALAREDVIALRYRFVDLTVNGRHLGIYALEEHFEKRLVEHNRRREGPILRFDESLFWQDELDASRFPGQGRQWNGAGSYFASAVDGFQTGATLADPARTEPYVLAASLLDGFRRGELPASEVFDIERTARFFALSDLLGAEHGTRWHNLRFYFNPVTSRLEPVGFDGFETSGWTGWQDSGLPPPARTLSGIHLLDAEAWGHNARLFADPALFEAYYRALDRYSRPDWVEGLLGELEPELEAELAVLYRGFPYYRFSRDLIRQNAAYVRAALRPTAPLRAFAAPEGVRRAGLELGNVQNIPLQVLGVRLGDRDLTSYGGTVVLPGRRGTAAVDYRRLRLPMALGEDPPPAALAGLQVRYRFLGGEEVYEGPVTPLPREDRAMLDAALDRELPNAGDFDFLVVDEAARRVEIQPGRWRLDRRLVLPAGYTLTAQGRVSLDLVDGASVLSRAALRLEGEPGRPLLIESSDGSGGGLIVLEPGAPSSLRDVTFRNLAAPAEPAWAPTGAVTFYGAPVRLERVRFESARAEDALNLVRSDFELIGCTFDGSGSDALDVDFGEGRIAATRFVDSGNDALDVSGTSLQIEGSSIEGFGDKGLSAGEASQVQGRDLRVAGGEIGVASKDRSRIELSGLRLSGLRVGLTAYQKKPEYGPGSLVVEGLGFDGSGSASGESPAPIDATAVGAPAPEDAAEAWQAAARAAGLEHLWLLEPASSLHIEGREWPPNAEALEERFYGVEFGKASR